ncbi:enoyl-CoA hydratase [Leucobacter exalbidus]|uniref:3-hydroxyisobutyryl-CoA hydrolase n=1 Tax=Leucobacter exalbidus TaxID=662960 RepID=A0A940T2G6_9MICO|nr:enoyl-CoA hydratase/isomerase family protein [Leucobacter exalbidus]MBP1324783.1 enoyl-CoA hydratase [Leucobacter exalbidus]
MSTATTQPETTQPRVYVRREGAITRITLNRPRALNALTSDMFALVKAGVAAAQTDGSQAIVLDGAGDRGFCGGGDIKQLSGPGSRDILALEYSVDYAVATSQVPVIGMMDGVTMGGGIGLAGHAHHRIVTERSRLAMPEARIGIVPDVGGHKLLARAPHHLGEYLALTASEMTPADALALDFADHLVPHADLDALREALAAGEAPAAACARFATVSVPREEAISEFSVSTNTGAITTVQPHALQAAPKLQSAPLMVLAEWWGPLAAQALGENWRAVFADPAAAALRIIAALEAAAATDADHAQAAAATAVTIKAMCPTSLAVTLAQIARTRAFDFSLAEVLTDDLRVVGRLAVRPDFAEGARAQVIDKDRNPIWQPATLEGLDAHDLAGILDPALHADEPPLGL